MKITSANFNLTIFWENLKRKFLFTNNLTKLYFIKEVN